MITAGYITSVLYALLCIGGAGLLYKLGVPKPITRKFVHILVGFEWVILNFFMGASPHFFAVALIITVALAIEYKIKLFPMMSSDSDNSPGTVYYAVAMSVMSGICCFVPEMTVPFGIGVFCTSFGDGFAGLVGGIVKKHNPKIYGNKTLFGTLSAFAVSFAATFAVSRIYSYPLSAWQCLAIAFLSASLELVFGLGLDNIAVTLGTAALAYAFVYLPAVTDYLVPILLTPLFIGYAYKKRALTLDGIIAAVTVDITISIPFGNFGFVTLGAFFVGGMLADKYKKAHKNTRQKTDKKKKKQEAPDAPCETRNSIQVFANAFAASVAAALYLWTKNQIFVIAFVAAMTESLADTVASGIGTSAKRVFNIIGFKPCEPGISGGVSLPGTLSALAASVLLPATSVAFGAISILQLPIVALAAFVGVLIDSLLGSLLQAKYNCNVCSRTVEKAEHCGEKCTLVGGHSFIDNDVVNLVSNILTAIIAALLFIPFT